MERKIYVNGKFMPLSMVVSLAIEKGMNVAQYLESVTGHSPVEKSTIDKKTVEGYNDGEWHGFGRKTCYVYGAKRQKTVKTNRVRKLILPISSPEYALVREHKLTVTQAYNAYVARTTPAKRVVFTTHSGVTVSFESKPKTIPTVICAKKVENVAKKPVVHTVDVSKKPTVIVHVVRKPVAVEKVPLTRAQVLAKIETQKVVAQFATKKVVVNVIKKHN